MQVSRVPNELLTEAGEIMADVVASPALGEAGGGGGRPLEEGC